MLIEDYLIPSSYGAGYYLSVRIKTNDPFLKNPVILTHGKGMPCELNWDLPLGGVSFADLLVEQGGTVILFNALGFGESSKYPAQYLPPSTETHINTFNDFFRDFEDLFLWLREVGITPATLVSWSTSVFPGLMYAAAYPMNVQTLMCLGTPVVHSVTEAPTMLNYVDNTPEIIINRILNGIPEGLFPTEYETDITNKIMSYPTQSLFGSCYDMTILYSGMRQWDEWSTNKVNVPTVFIEFSYDASGKNPSQTVINKYIDSTAYTDTIDDAGHFLLLQANRTLLVDSIIHNMTLK